MARKIDMSGLKTFLDDIRNCKGKEEELKRVNTELAKIRNKFRDAAKLKGYDKKKYLSKLVYIFLLGYNFDDFAHDVAIKLLECRKYSEKRIGYIFMSVLMIKKSNLILSVQNALVSELRHSRSPEHQILALNYVANWASVEMVDAFTEPVLQLLFASDTCDTVKQSAILGLLSLFRLKPDVISENDYSDRIISFLTYHDLGVVTAAVSLIDALVAGKKIDPAACISPTISKLKKIVNSDSADYADYSYYFVSAPWLTIKLLNLLKQCPYPSKITLQTSLVECIAAIFNKIQDPPKTKKVAHRNCKNAIMFEAISLIHYMSMQPELQIGACNILEVSLKHKESNTRYLVLESMILLSGTEICQVRLKEQLNTVIDLMQEEKDICLRRKLTRLLYALCDETNVQQVLEELFYYMQTEDITLKEEMVLRMSILAEKYSQDRTWYIDVILNILKEAGEYVSETVGYKLIQVITNEEEIQNYAAKSAFEALETSHYNEKLVKVVGYILGEFGNLIAGSSKFSPMVQLRLLHSNFYLSSNETKATLLTTYMKFANLYPDYCFIREEIKQIFKTNTHNIDSEIQQRAVEYLKLCEIAHDQTLKTVFDKMPHVQKETCVEEALPKVKMGTSEINPLKNIGLKKSNSYNNIWSKQYNVESNTLKKYVSLTNIQNELVNLSEIGYNTLQDVSPLKSNDCSSSQKLNSVCFTTTNEALNFLIWHEKGILYESNILSVYAYTEFTNYKGQIRLIYTNKTSEVLHNFIPHFPGENSDKIKLDVTPSTSMLKPNKSLEQSLYVECKRDFDHYPYFILNFNFLNFTECISIFLPLTLNKFITPVTMTSEEFFGRWNLCKQKFEKTFPAKNVMERRLVENKIEGIGLMLLPNIDPNKENFTAAGIFHSKFKQIGLLLRLEPDYKTRSYKLTVKSIQLTVSNEVAKLVMLIL